MLYMRNFYLKIISQSYLIRRRRTGIIDLILILFYFYAVQDCGKIKYVKNMFCLVMRNPF